MDENFLAAMDAMQLTPQEQFLYQYHLNNLAGPGAVHHPDGSISTVYQTTVEINGKTYTIPTVWNGQIVPPDQAVQNAQAMGLDKFPSYDDEKTAQSRYDKMHDYMEKDVQSFRKQQPSPAATDALSGSATDNALAAPTQGPR